MDNRKRYSFLLFGLILVFILSPILRDLPAGGIWMLALSIWILGASFYAVWDDKKQLLFISALGGSGLIFELLQASTESSLSVIASLAFQIPYFALITWVLFRRLLTARKVDTDSILGAICVYFLIGLTFGYLYQLIEVFFTGSFSHTVNSNVLATQADANSNFFYFSFITMTTIGYGDITPLHPVARSLAMLHGVAGQMYIAILVARLVSLYTLESSNCD